MNNERTAALDAELATTPSRWIKGRKVYIPEVGDPWVLAKRVDGSRARRRGVLKLCEVCGAEFWQSHASKRDQTACGAKCGGRVSSRTKRKQLLNKGGPSRDQLDRWFSMIVRSVGHCRYCGTTERLQCAHIVSRRYLGVRFDFGNAYCLCAGCHLRFTHRPLEWEQYVIEQMGEEAYRDLKRRALDSRGPLDRVAIGEALFARADELGLRNIRTAAPGWGGWNGVTDRGESA